MSCMLIIMSGLCSLWQVVSLQSEADADDSQMQPEYLSESEDDEQHRESVIAKVVCIFKIKR